MFRVFIEIIINIGEFKNDTCNKIVEKICNLNYYILYNYDFNALYNIMLIV